MKIVPIQIWHNGYQVEANQINASIVQDDLSQCAEFLYTLQSVTHITNVPLVTPMPGFTFTEQELKEIEKSLPPLKPEIQDLVNGNVKIEGEDYATWNDSQDVNLAAYQYICNKLNLTLIN